MIEKAKIELILYFSRPKLVVLVAFFFACLFICTIQLNIELYLENSIDIFKPDSVLNYFKGLTTSFFKLFFFPYAIVMACDEFNKGLMARKKMWLYTNNEFYFSRIISLVITSVILAIFSLIIYTIASIHFDFQKTNFTTMIRLFLDISFWVFSGLVFCNIISNIFKKKHISLFVYFLILFSERYLKLFKTNLIEEFQIENYLPLGFLNNLLKGNYFTFIIITLIYLLILYFDGKRKRCYPS